jgi:hypothetical protein
MISFSSTTGAILGGGRSVFSGSSALGGSNAPVINLSSEHLQNGQAAALLQSGAQGMSSGAFAGDDSKVSCACVCFSLLFRFFSHFDKDDDRSMSRRQERRARQHPFRPPNNSGQKR